MQLTWLALSSLLMWLALTVVGVNAAGDRCGMHLCLCGLHRCQRRRSWDASAFHINRVGLCIALAKGLAESLF